MTINFEQVAEIWGLVLGYFAGDVHRAELWMHTENPGLGRITPERMILIGRSKVLLAFIRDSQEGQAA